MASEVGGMKTSPNDSELTSTTACEDNAAIATKTETIQGAFKSALETVGADEAKSGAPTTFSEKINPE